MSDRRDSGRIVVLMTMLVIGLYLAGQFAGWPSLKPDPPERPVAAPDKPAKRRIFPLFPR